MTRKEQIVPVILKEQIVPVIVLSFCSKAMPEYGKMVEMCMSHVDIPHTPLIEMEQSVFTFKITSLYLAGILPMDQGESLAGLGT